MIRLYWEDSKLYQKYISRVVTPRSTPFKRFEKPMFLGNRRGPTDRGIYPAWKMKARLTSSKASSPVMVCKTLDFCAAGSDEQVGKTHVFWNKEKPQQKQKPTKQPNKELKKHVIWTFVYLKYCRIKFNIQGVLEYVLPLGLLVFLCSNGSNSGQIPVTSPQNSKV